MGFFNTILRQCAEYRKAGLDAGVSIKLSADDLRDPELTELFEQGLNLWGVTPGDVMVELIKTAVMDDSPGSLHISFSCRFTTARVPIPAIE